MSTDRFQTSDPLIKVWCRRPNSDYPTIVDTLMVPLSIAQVFGIVDNHGDNEVDNTLFNNLKVHIQVYIDIQQIIKESAKS